MRNWWPMLRKWKGEGWAVLAVYIHFRRSAAVVAAEVDVRLDAPLSPLVHIASKSRLGAQNDIIWYGGRIQRLSAHVLALFIPNENTELPSYTSPLPQRPHGSHAYEQTCRFSTEPKANGLRSSDTWNLKHGRLYHLTLRKTTCKWVYKDEMEEGHDVARRRKLEKQPAALVKPDFQAMFTGG